jgi:hypothetical protein
MHNNNIPMAKRIILIIAIQLMVLYVALGHEGHGVPAPGWLHYLLSPLHWLLPLSVGALIGYFLFNWFKKYKDA